MANLLLNLPEILKVPEKLLAVIKELDNYRYFLLEGGRGGGKSHAIARFILYLCEQYKLRVVCGREIQNSISESVHSLMKDLITDYQLFYDVFANRIEHREKGSTINFRGFREHGKFNIQGMEGIDICWIDEAQAITEQTLNILIPTIRKDTAKIFFSMNRYQLNDPVYQKIAHRDDCLHIHIDYFDNEFCTKVLHKEANECKLISEADYNHIWLGQPLDQSENSVFTISELQDSKKNKHPLREGYGLRIGGFDIARYGDDASAYVCLQQMGALHWETFKVDEWRKMDLNFTTGRILTLANEDRLDMSIIDEDGMGAGPLDSIKKGRGREDFVGFRNPAYGYGTNSFFGNPRTENTYKLKEMISAGHLHITDDQLIEELLSIKYTFDHNQRRILISKDKMKKDGIKSPNKADALIMAASLIGKVQKKQETQYRRVPQYSKEADLFKTIGV